MKTIFKSLILICSLILAVSVFTRCKKDTDCKIVINCRMKADTNRVVSGADITIRKGDILVEGATDGSGQFFYTFKLEAIFDVFADKGTMHGQTIIRLKAGETVSQTVLIQ